MRDELHKVEPRRTVKPGHQRSPHLNSGVRPALPASSFSSVLRTSSSMIYELSHVFSVSLNAVDAVGLCRNVRGGGGKSSTRRTCGTFLFQFFMVGKTSETEKREKPHRTNCFQTRRAASCSGRGKRRRYPSLCPKASEHPQPSLSKKKKMQCHGTPALSPENLLLAGRG